MKKTIITMLIALVAMVASAETYNYLKFTKTNGSTVTYSVEGLKLTYTTSNVIVTNVEGTSTIALAEVQDMYFTNEAAPAFVRGDVNGDNLVNMDDLTALINYLVYGSSVNQMGAASCSNPDDTVVNMDDLTALINFLVYNAW